MIYQRVWNINLSWSMSITIYLVLHHTFGGLISGAWWYLPLLWGTNSGYVIDPTRVYFLRLGLAGNRGEDCFKCNIPAGSVFIKEIKACNIPLYGLVDGDLYNGFFQSLKNWGV